MLIIGKGATIVGTENTHWPVGLNMLCMALGFLSYSLSRKIFTSVRTRRWVFLVLGSLLSVYILLLLGPLRTGSIPAYLQMLSGEAFLMGHLSGYIFYYMAFSLQDSPYLGRVIGIAMAVSVTIQNIIQHHMPQILETAAITLVITIVGMMLVLWQAPHDLVFENALPYEKKPPAFPRQGRLGILMILMMTLMSGFIDSHLTYLNAHEILDEADWPRLLYAVGLIAAGFLADLRKHEYLPLFTACASVLCIPTGALLLFGSAYNLALSLSYFFAGFFVIYIMVFFMELAPRTKDPSLWVVMGRLVYCALNGTMVLFAPWLRDLVTGNIMLGINTLLVIFLFILSYLQGQPQIELEPDKEKVKKVPLSPLESFGAAWAFTPREMEVFQLLTDGDLTIQDIADQLFISRRVCQRYLTSMYEKTGTKTRLNLLLKYYRNDPDKISAAEKDASVLAEK